MVAVPSYIAANASRGLDLLEYAGDGLRPATVREARAMAGGNVSEDKVTRMAAWFARHRGDLDSPKAGEYLRGETERPTPGQVAWLLWGGSLGTDRMNAMTWAERTRDRLEKQMDYDLRKDIVEENGEWCVYSEDRGRRFGCYPTEAAAEERLAQIESFSRSLDDMTAEQLIAAHHLTHKNVDDDNVMLARHVIEHRLEAIGFAPPYTTGDTTTKLAALHEVVPFAKAEERYTLGPVYVPGRLDGHGEFIDSDTLQKAIWDWVRSGDRTIFLQHSEKAAGEMVEILTWPMPIQTSLSLPGEDVRKVEFPAETPFMGVVWESWAWELVKAGQLRGYSIGGKARRIEADLSLTSHGE